MLATLARGEPGISFSDPLSRGAKTKSTPVLFRSLSFLFLRIAQASLATTQGKNACLRGWGIDLVLRRVRDSNPGPDLHRETVFETVPFNHSGNSPAYSVSKIKKL